MSGIHHISPDGYWFERKAFEQGFRVFVRVPKQTIFNQKRLASMKWLEDTFGEGAFTEAPKPFHRWMRAHHGIFFRSEEDAALFLIWRSAQDDSTSES